jgi:hypothetical protein
LQIRWKADPTSVAPTEVDHSNIVPGLYKNDTEGDCGPTSACNITRTVTKYETGTQVSPAQTACDALYSASTAPPFDPATGANDNGVDNPTMYGAWLDVGLGDGIEKPICYGQLANLSDASIALALDVFGAATMAVDLETAQQAQSDAPDATGKITWDYKKTGEWGGHDICLHSISKKAGSLVGAWSWAEWAWLTANFRKHQMIEIFLPVFASVVATDKFDALIDRDALDSDLFNLTNTYLPSSPAPASGLTLAVTDPDVVQHITKVSKSTTPDAWATKHFRSYFNVKD